MGGRTDKSDGERRPERSSLIYPPLRDRSPALRPGIPGDDVDVEVHHRLAGVVAVGVEPAVDEDFCLPEEGEEGGKLGVRRVEEIRDVPEGDEEEVAGVYRVFIVAGVAEVVGEDDLFGRRVGEGSGQGAHASYPRTWIKQAHFCVNYPSLKEGWASCLFDR